MYTVVHKDAPGDALGLYPDEESAQDAADSLNTWAGQEIYLIREVADA